MVSHELRQPLASVQHALDLLRTAVAEDSAERQRVVEVAGRNVRRLADLIRTLGLIAGPNHDTPQLQVIDPRKLVADVAEQLREAADRKGVEIVSHIDVAEMCVDVARFELLLVNLVSNGIKYRDPAKPAARVEIRLDPTDAGWLMTIADNGLGIRAEDQATVFRRFYRGHAERDEELGNSGSGLGLAIASECARGLGGTIRLESAEGRGTTFIVTWPKRSLTD